MDFHQGGKAMTRDRSASHSPAVLVVSVMGTIMFSSQITLADGKYFPEKAYKVAPAIPAQRAILVYRDGIEKLTIESSLDGKGHEFGWVIPLPSRPTEFKEVSPGLIRTLGWAIQPYVTHDLRQELRNVVLIAVPVTLVCLIMALTKPPGSILLLVPVIIVGVLCSLVQPLHRAASLGGSSMDISGVHVRDIQEVGSYDVVVLDANDAAALNTWLEDNGFASLNEADRTIVSDYIRNGWCFVAARLRRENDGYSRPHPISMSFASEALIYPVRLTATAGNDVYLELYVIAERQAACEKLTLEVADTYDRPRRGKRTLSPENTDPGFLGRAHRQGVGHPAAAEQFWDGCVLSKLCGTLTPKAMDRDITLQLRTHEPSRKRYFSGRGAFHKALVFGLCVWCAAFVSLTVFFRKTMNQQGKLVVFFKRIVLPALLLSFLTSAATYSMVPKVNTQSLGQGGVPHRIYEKIEQQRRLVEAQTIAEEHRYFTGMSRDETAAVFKSYYASKGSTNGFTGEAIRYEDSPGNYTILQDGRGIVWRAYSLQGYPDDLVLTSPLHNSGR